MARDFGVAGLLRPDAATLPEVDEDRKLRVGMFMYVLADAFMAIFLIGTYIFLRAYNTNGRWFPPGSAEPSLWQNFWIMIIVVAGAVAYGIGELALGRGSRSLFRYAMLVAALLYLGDAVFQIIAMAHLPFTVDNAGAYASSFILLAGYHAYHMVIGAFLGIGVVNRAFRGYYDTSVVASGTTPNVSHGVQAGAVAGHETVDHTTAPEEFPQRNTSGIASIGYFWYYAAIYAVAFWLLLVIQPVNYHP